MIRVIIFLFASLFLIACANTESDTVLTSAPYASLTDSIRQVPGNADLWYRRGVLLFQKEEFGRAKSDLRQAWKLSPREDIALGLVATLRRESDDSAFHFLQVARRALPQSLPLAIGLARAYQKKGQPAAALELCDNILNVYPNQLDVLSLKAELQESTGSEEGAIHTLEQAYAYAPFDVELVHRLAFAYAQSGNEKALSLSDSLIRADQQGAHAEPYYFKGLYFEARGQNAEALHQLDEAVRHDYNFLDAYMEKGQIQFGQKQYAAAQTTFGLALRITPSFADAYYWTAKCQEAQGNKADAKLNYQRAYGLDKTNTEAKAAAARL
jgi:tetratricopeptide (TPR) repeat protein